MDTQNPSALNTAGLVSGAPLPEVRLQTKDLSVLYNKVNYGVKNINLTMYTNKVTAFIGPSGCGKTTFLRSLNRMHDLSPEAQVTGHALLDGEDIYGPNVDPVVMRRKIGMVFQKPTPFPTKSIYDNVTAGLALVGIKNKKILDDVVEQSLINAALWDEVKDRLRSPGGSLSGGQQQRLSIARALAIEPEVLLMDEPTSSLDPMSTARIEELIQQLKDKVTIVIVTHNMQQAARVSDYTAFFFLGELIEMQETPTLFNNPAQIKTREYLSGAFS
jgi:phosphate transport system ATP-binding protein